MHNQNWPPVRISPKGDDEEYRIRAARVTKIRIALGRFRSWGMRGGGGPSPITIQIHHRSRAHYKLESSAAVAQRTSEISV